MTQAYMTVAQACEHLHVSPDTLRRYARQGRISRVRISPRKLLYIRDEIDGLAKEGTYKIA
ncbi:helix-turn-helix domain-containing protein [Corynebacterium sp. zg-331]|uniref:helix-turn-helix domain-containing protein n=1 Tax=unclassified Corynebacterium TaxID=2624378 RepID=UPI00128C61D1|nr:MULTISPECIES: helix-turn-helix domain-containing protein [unclassified Corynebacterium]MBC3186308.1 helix-turn-helix domain-containing protein [Corynebacterium sp. zg-331]MPV52796.1 helix-turn-helix domain-containing protein [Corynebacterium sp. zg331]